MLAACGSNKDVDAVSYYIFDQKDSLSEKDARCLAKNFKKIASDDQWDIRVKIANGEMSEFDLSLSQNMDMYPLWTRAGYECDVKMFNLG